MVKSVTLVCLFTVLAVVLANDKYTDKYDHVNEKEIVENRRLLISLYKCIMDEGPCTPEGNEVKAHIREALENNCGKCSEIQYKKVRFVVEHFINNEPDMWNALGGKYDPNNIYKAKYEQELKRKA